MRGLFIRGSRRLAFCKRVPQLSKNYSISPYAGKISVRQHKFLKIRGLMWNAFVYFTVHTIYSMSRRLVVWVTTTHSFQLPPPTSCKYTTTTSSWIRESSSGFELELGLSIRPHKTVAFSELRGSVRPLVRRNRRGTRIRLESECEAGFGAAAGWVLDRVGGELGSLWVGGKVSEFFNLTNRCFILFSLGWLALLLFCFILCGIDSHFCFLLRGF